MKKKVIEFCRKLGYWRTAYSGKDKILYIHASSTVIANAIILEFGELPFKIEVQLD